jgi:hypothetical protein
MTMRTLSVSVGLGLVLLLAGAAAAGEGEQVYGQGVSAADTVLVSALLANPDAYVGQTIRVKGQAVGVCESRGCWVNLASDVEGETVRVKVKDGEIVFPPELVGDIVLAEGVWTANQLDLETTKKVCENEAKSKGEAFEAAGVTTCMTLYQLSGTGAVATKK